MTDKRLHNGSLMMLIAAIGFIGYGILFAIMNFTAAGFELGVDTVGGMERGDLDPTVSYYIGHLHVATAAFIIATGIGVGALSWYGVRDGQMWAWVAAVAAPVVALAMALPMHWTADAFEHEWVLHLGPIYVATALFVAGALLSLGAMRMPSQD